MSGITENVSHAGDGVARRLDDPAFKLFGRTIPVSSDCKKPKEEDRVAASNESPCFQDVGDEAPESEDESGVPDELGSSSGNDGCDEEKINEMIEDGLENPVIPEEGVDREDDGQEDTSLDQAPKKPDKPIPCPRCESLDTKFCYFNNYNVSQPRHFCKNCQRYWTAGGTLRNVPVGAGRRKNKHSVAHQRSMLPDGLVVRGDPPENAQQLLSCPGSSPVGLNRHVKIGPPSCSPRHLLPLDVPSSTVLSFGQEVPVCGSTGATPFTPRRSEVLQGYKPEMSQAQVKVNLKVDAGLSTPLDTDKKFLDGKHYKEQNPPGIANGIENKANKPALWQPVQPIGEPAASSMESAQLQVPFTVTTKPEAGTPSDMSNNVDAALAWATGAPFSIVGGPWPYGANLGWGNMAPATAIANALQGAMSLSSNFAGTNPPQAVNSVTQPPWAGAVGGLWSGIPWPLMQSPLWGPPAWGGAWTMPWAAPAAAAVAAVAAAAAAAANPALGSPILGKRLREQGEVDSEKGGSLLVPKTLRIDDPGEAAQSSIWATLGLGNRSDTFGSGGIFRDFQSKAESKETDDPLAQARNFNPAAMNRSVVFQESNLASQNVDFKGK